MRAATFTLGSILALAAPAHADAPSGGIVVADFVGPSSDGRAAAALLRSVWAGGKHPAVPHADTVALKAQSFELGGERFKEAIAATHAGYAAVGNVEHTGDVVEVCIQTVDASANPVGQVCRRGAAADLSAVVLDAARTLAPKLGADVDATVSASLDELVPFVGAEQAARFDAARAEAALAAADPSVAARVVDVRRSMAALAGDAALAPALRLRAAIAAGDAELMMKTAATAPKSEALAGLVARAHAAAGQPASGGHGADAALARADAALRAGKPAVAAHELGPLVAHTPPDVAALALVAAQTASLGDDLENRVAAVAGKAPPQLAARLLIRAAKDGRDVAAAVGALPVAAVASDRLRELAAVLPAGAPGRARLDAELKARADRAAATRTAADDHAATPTPTPSTPTPAAEKPAAATPPATAAKPAATKAPASKPVGPDVETLSQALLPLLTRFAPLIGHAGTAIHLGGPGESATFAPRWIDRDLLRQALVHALASEPLSLQVVPDAAAPLSLDAAAALQGGKAEVTLTLHQAGDDKPQVEKERVIVHGVDLVRTGLAFWLVVVGSILGLAAAAAWVAFRFLRVGHVDVHLHNKLGADQENIAILLSSSSECPKIDDPAEFDRKERKRGPKTAMRRRSMAAGRTEFSGVPAGVWYVHLFGVVRRNGELGTLPHGLTRTILVEPRGTVRVDFELSSAAAELRIQVVDGKPVRGASIVIDALAEPLTTSATGEVATLLPPGEYQVEIAARGTHVVKRVPITDTGTVKLVVDLIAERNPEAVAEEQA